MSTGAIPLADITEDLVTAYQKDKTTFIQLFNTSRKDYHKTSQITFASLLRSNLKGTLRSETKFLSTKSPLKMKSILFHLKSSFSRYLNFYLDFLVM